jgi:spermidine synthase
MGLAMADVGDEGAVASSQPLCDEQPAECAIVRAHLRMQEGRYEEAATDLETAFTQLRTNPWPMIQLSLMALRDARALLLRDTHQAVRLFRALSQPFALHEYDELRRRVVLGAALRSPGCVEAFAGLEPFGPWEGDFLSERAACYRDSGAPLAAAAQADLEEWRAGAPARFALEP